MKKNINDQPDKEVHRVGSRGIMNEELLLPWNGEAPPSWYGYVFGNLEAPSNPCSEVYMELSLLCYNWLNHWPVCQSVQLLSRVWHSATPWTAARQASLSITDSCSLLKLISIESEMPSNHLILCCPLLLLPSVLPSIRVFSNESILRIR